MILLPVRHYRTMLIVSVISFFMGNIVTLGLAPLQWQCDCMDRPATINKKELSDSLSQYKYAVLVISGPNNTAKRNAIRATWGKFSYNIITEYDELIHKWDPRTPKEHNMIKMFFTIGTEGLDNTELSKLKTENSKTNDLLLLDSFEDSYNKLTAKMLHSLKWIGTNMRNLKYLIKCDDDSFVRVDLVVKELEQYAPDMNSPAQSKYISIQKKLDVYKGLYWGYFSGQASVRLHGKWKQPDWFLCDTYLPYSLGGGYVISRSIVDYIARNADFLSLYTAEDVSMGVWTAALDGINRVHDVRFDTEWKSRGCLSDMLIRHKQSPQDMLQLYETLVESNGNRLCTHTISTRNAYMYNWHVLPSSCCK